MTIIHLSSSLGGGGAEQMVLQLAKKSHPEIRTIVISISSDNTLQKHFEQYGIECYFLDITSFKNHTIVNGIKKLKFILNDISDGIFHCHQFHGFILGFVYNLLYKPNPLVFTLHSSVVEQLNRKVLLYLTKPFRKKDIIFSKNAKKWFLKNSVIIPNGVDFEELSNLETRINPKGSDFYFLYLGRLSKEKNPLSMIKFSKELIESKVLNFKINVVGQGALKQQLEESIKAEKLENYFNIIGFQSNVRRFLIESHCMILPSFWEGMPVVLIEAAATKLPIISTPVGSIPDFLNNKNASISNINNFSTAMKSMILNYDEALIKSEILFRESKENFKIENVYEKHLHLYESLLNK